MPLSEAALLGDPLLALPLARLLATRSLARLAPERHTPQHRGRLARQPGLTFKELRPYQSGDEVRHIDWRVTARLGRPHTRLYHDEQEQTCAVWLDLGRDMYFGSRMQLKARLGAELAAALLWQGLGRPLWLQAGDGPALTHTRRPEPLLAELCARYTHGLARRETAQALPPHHPLPDGCVLNLITDRRTPPPLLHWMGQLARRHPLRLWQIVDPLELALPPHARLPVTSHTGRGWLDGERRHDYAAAARAQDEAQLAQLLPLVERLYRLDNGRPLAEQWQEGPCRLI